LKTSKENRVILAKARDMACLFIIVTLVSVSIDWCISVNYI